MSDSLLHRGCPESQQNWKKLPLGFPICELVKIWLLQQTKACLPICELTSFSLLSQAKVERNKKRTLTEAIEA